MSWNRTGEPLRHPKAIVARLKNAQADFLKAISELG
jgi:hypothetical protein